MSFPGASFGPRCGVGMSGFGSTMRPIGAPYIKHTSGFGPTVRPVSAPYIQPSFGFGGAFSRPMGSYSYPSYARYVHTPNYYDGYGSSWNHGHRVHVASNPIVDGIATVAALAFLAACFPWR